MRYNESKYCCYTALCRLWNSIVSSSDHLIMQFFLWVNKFCTFFLISYTIVSNGLKKFITEKTQRAISLNHSLFILSDIVTAQCNVQMPHTQIHTHIICLFLIATQGGIYIKGIMVILVLYPCLSRDFSPGSYNSCCIGTLLIKPNCAAVINNGIGRWGERARVAWLKALIMKFKWLATTYMEVLNGWPGGEGRGE